MPAIDPTTVPGSVSLPTWTLIAAIVVLFCVRELERKKWFEKVGSATDALNKNNDLIEKMTDTLAALSERVRSLELTRSKGGDA